MKSIKLIRFLLFYLAFSTCSSYSYSQSDNSNQFFIKGKLLNKHTGKVVLSYVDYDEPRKDTAILRNGEFSFSGKVNGACEAILWTNLKTINIDDKTVLRFLLDASNYTINFSENRKPASIITGSKLQREKENWDNEKVKLLEAKADYYHRSDSLYKLSKTSVLPGVQNAINKLPREKDSLLGLIREKDILYIKEYPDSYLSGYLLSWHERKISLDSVQNLYKLLSKKVKNSTVGNWVLAYIYPLTNDEPFRTANPLHGKTFGEQLTKIKSIYEFSCSDSSGNKINFSSFKGKYLVIDFWASWCVPCIDNIPSLKKMIEDYKDYPIEFISISLDKDNGKWKNALNKYKLSGIQVIEPKSFESLLAVYFKVLWVYHYLIIDKNGKIKNPKAPPALDPELKIILDKLLSKNN